MYSLILKAAAYWLLGFGTANVVSKKYPRATTQHDLYMLLVVSLGLYAFTNYFSWTANIYLLFVASLLLNHFVATTVYKFGTERGAKPKNLINNNPNMLFLRLDNRFLFSKAIEIVFQQIAMLGLLQGVKVAFGTSLEVILLGGLVFGILHLPLLKQKESYGDFSFLFFISSFIGGLVFSYILYLNPNYIIYSYTVHIQWYVFLGLYYWIKIKHNNLVATQ